jgi:AraC-like DNA-binding protein
MSARANLQEEAVVYVRSHALAGVEAVNVTCSEREWRVLCPDYAVVVFKTWRGRIRTLGRLHSAQPGVAFCITPGEPFAARPDSEPGSFNVLRLESNLFEEWLSEHAHTGRPAWASLLPSLSQRLGQEFGKFFELFEPSACALQLQSQGVELAAAMLPELVERGRRPHAVSGAALRGTALMRECLNQEADIDLEGLARHAGLSRFQALRAFKRRYGMPPHAYQLCLRVSQAQRLLRDGLPGSEVALRCGFADQSHFIRHFKRLSGVTPLEYARGHAPTLSSAKFTRARREPVEQSWGGLDPTTVVSRPDH